MKKIVSAIVVAAMLVGLIPHSVNAEEQIMAETEIETTEVEATATDADDSEAIYSAYGENDIVRVDDYTYEIIPLLPPFNDLFYVKTDNPDIGYVRFVDKDSVYYTQEDYDREDCPCAIRPVGVRFSDVVYEDYETGRVNGGYIFARYYGYEMDGGDLVLQQGDRPYYRIKTSYGYSESTPVYTDTNVTVSCPAVKSSIQYLIDNYASSENDFFTNLSNVQSALYSMAVYPKGVLDTSKPNKSRPYPLLAVSPYYELSLNAHYDMYESGDSLLALAVHPYVLHSLTFPGTIAAVAETLEPDCTISAGNVHYRINVEYNGETRSYGGAGTGSSNDLYSNCIEKLYTFDGTSNDFAYNASIEKINNKYFEYQTATNKELEGYKSQIAGSEYASKTGAGVWLRVASEGFGYGRTYAYVTSYGPESGSISMEDAWVDGRYVSIYNCYTDEFKFGDTYEYGNGKVIDTSKSTIVIRNKTFTDYYGNTVTRDVVYFYTSSTDTWRAPYSYVGRSWYSSSIVLPDDMILTRDEVNQMVANGEIGGKVDLLPESGLIYDGTVEPGTPFNLSADCQKSMHNFVEEENPSDSNLFSEASCTEPAKYRKVCSGCGIVGNDVYEYGSAKGHSEKLTYVGNHMYQKTCSVCNARLGEILKSPTANGIYVAKMDRTGITAGLVTSESDKSNYEYSWYACKDGETWILAQDWTLGNEWLNWTPKEFGEYVLVCKARIKGDDATTVQATTNVSYHPVIKGICQMPYTGKGGGYLIGIESYDNPNQSYTYEMLILDCTLLAQGLPAWTYTTGRCYVPDNCLWTIWQPQYGYYWTLFRLYDENGNLIDERCYGFENIC